MPIFAPNSSADTLRRRAALAAFVTLAAGPPLWGVGYALAYSFGFVGALSSGFTVEHWQGLGKADSDVVRSFGFSFAVATVTVVGAAASAVALSQVLRGTLSRGLAATALFVPLVIPGVVAALVGFQFLGSAGLLARLAWRAGLIAEPDQFPALIYDQFGIGIVLTHLAVAVPWLTLLFIRIHANERVDDYVALARTLGAGRLAAVRRVVLPMLLRRAAPTLTLYFAAVLGSYEIPLLLGAQRPEMISILVRRKFALFDLTQRPEAFLIAALYAVLVFVLVLLVFRKTPSAHVS